MENRFHCCATCIHFSAKKRQSGGMKYECLRLNFETKTTYTFTCWEPKKKVEKLMQKEMQH